MLNLTLHCGGQTVERRTVESCPTPRGTATWTPVPHLRLLEQVQGALAGAGLNVVNEAHALSFSGARYFGLLEIRGGEGAADYALVLGLRNSHDQSFPAGLAVGSGVFICDNLAFSSEIVIARRHTRFIERDLPGLVDSAIGRLGDLRGLQDRRIAAYKETHLNDVRAHHLTVRAMMSRIVPPTQMPVVVREWHEPRFPQFVEGGKTGWRLFNAYAS
jgi:hypothetical protein